MKKTLLCIMIAILSLTFMPVQLKASSVTVTNTPITPADSARALVLLNRLDEINAMDKSELNSSEKKELRKEVRSTKKQLSDISGGIYISAGAAIIILLLLILLL